MSEYRSIDLVTAGVSIQIYPDPMGGDEEDVTPPTIVVTTSVSDIEWSIMVNGVVLSKEIASIKRFRPEQKEKS